MVISFDSQDIDNIRVLNHEKVIGTATYTTNRDNNGESLKVIVGRGKTKTVYQVFIADTDRSPYPWEASNYVEAAQAVAAVIEGRNPGCLVTSSTKDGLQLHRPLFSSRIAQ